MDQLDAAEIVRDAWLDGEKPADCFDVLMTACPYCGKADRVMELTLKDLAQREDNLGAAWKLLSRRGRKVGACGFCRNVLLLVSGSAIAPGQ